MSEINSPCISFSPVQLLCSTEGFYASTRTCSISKSSLSLIKSRPTWIKKGRRHTFKSIKKTDWVKAGARRKGHSVYSCHEPQGKNEINVYIECRDLHMCKCMYNCLGRFQKSANPDLHNYLMILLYFWKLVLVCHLLSMLNTIWLHFFSLGVTVIILLPCFQHLWFFLLGSMFHRIQQIGPRVLS